MQTLCLNSTWTTNRHKNVHRDVWRPETMGGVTWSHTSFIYSLCFASADFSETLLSCCFFVFSQNFSYFKVLTLFIKYQNFLSFVFFWICARSRCLCWQQLDARCWGCRDKRRQRGGRLTFWAGKDADRRGAERWVTLAALDAFLRFLRTHLNFFFFALFYLRQLV